ncbi:MAG: prepilin peptidase [Candidatus Sumerlaeia bacterium]
MLSSSSACPAGATRTFIPSRITWPDRHNPARKRRRLIETLIDPVLFPFHVVFVFLFGTLWGSFFNVCIYRMPAGQSISMPGSYCYHCGTPIPGFLNVPVLSYFILGGRCRECAVPFSMRYALIEFLTGLLFLAVFLRYGFVWHLLPYIVFTSLLIVATFTDIDHWIILDRICLGGAAAGLIFALIIPLLPDDESARTVSRFWVIGQMGPVSGQLWYGPFLNALLGALAGSGLLYLIGLIGKIIFRKDAMGFGDVKLLVMIGAFIGWQLAIVTIFLGSCIGAIYGLTALAISKVKKAKAPNEPATAICHYDEIQQILDDESQAAQERGWKFTPAEKNVLNRILNEKIEKTGPGLHHLPFGPHLAIAAWLLMIFGPTFLTWLTEYLEPLAW